MRLGDPDGRKLIRRLEWSDSSPTRGSFSPDGRRAAWCSSGGEVRVYQLPARGK